MTTAFTIGVILLLVGVALVLLAWPGGSRLGELSMSRSMRLACGALCLTLTALGLILTVKE
jgi:multisubunit Na+/H+ antiporter MnhG subunit